LKRAGKKEHVVNGLVDQVRAFEAYLSQEGRAEVDAAQAEDIQDYAQALAPRERKKCMRGIALYYQWSGNGPLAKLATSIREQEVAKTRRPFRLRKFRGIDAGAVGQLEAIGIDNVEQMLIAGKTPDDRQELAEQSGLTPEFILELVKLSDLSRIGAVKSVRARLYYDAGLDTPHKFTAWEPEALREMLIGFVERTGFDGIAPLPKEVRSAIKTASRLPQVVDY
jgi:hypothetical protein